MTKVPIDRGVYEEIHESSHKSDRLYADDLTGCTVLAAHWPEKEGTGSKEALFVHVSQITLDNTDSLNKFMKDESKFDEASSIHDVLEMLTTGKEGKQPEKTFFVIKADSNNVEQYLENNKRLKEYISTNFKIEDIQEIKYKALGGDVRAEQDPYEDPAVSITDP